MNSETQAEASPRRGRLRGRRCGGRGSECSVDDEKNARCAIGHNKIYRSSRGGRREGGGACGGSARVGIAAPRAPGAAVPSLTARLTYGDLAPSLASP